MRKKIAFIMGLCLAGFTALNAYTQQGTVKPVIIEIIYPPNSTFNFGRFADMKGYGFENIQQWQNRVIVYAKTDNAKQLEQRIVKDYPNNKVVIFENPFYNFNRKYCDDQSVAKKWDNIILSANLVNDPKMQQEYLNYHATQFQKWPQVSQGFCNADFQQLLVFKTGRQLMLVISIPHGESLDKLNPLTTKNNPRVNDWNNIMKKYQQGIDGTKKGEVWVFFKEVSEQKFID